MRIYWYWCRFYDTHVKGWIAPVKNQYI